MSNSDDTVTNDVTVNLSTGEAYISQRKAAEKLGMTHQAIQQWCLARKYDVKQGLSSEIFSLLVTHYALDSKAATQEAKELLRKISQAGAKAYLYHEAGLSIGVTQQRPLTQLEAYEELVRMEKTRLALLDTVGAQQKRLGIQQQVITDKRNITNDGEDYFTAAAVKLLNPRKTLSGVLLSREAQKQEIAPIRQFGMGKVTTPNSYHRDVWKAVYPTIVLPN